MAVSRKATSSLDNTPPEESSAETQEDTKVSEAHPQLHHYTNWKGFSGIWQSQALRSVRFDSMNDPTEFQHVRELLVEALIPTFQEFAARERKKSGRIDKNIKEAGGIKLLVETESNNWIEIVYSSMEKTNDKKEFITPHITSFCSHTNDQPYERENGLLSQWRAYGGEEAFCIVFDTNKLEIAMNREREMFEYIGAYFVDVEYADSKFDIGGRYPELIKDLFTVWKNMLYGHEENSGAAQILEPLLKVGTRVKHRAYAEEREVRIVTLPVTEEYLQSKNAIPPRKPIKKYFQAPKPHITLFDESRSSLPITRIIVGPGNNQEAAYNKALKLVDGRVPIVRSATPYR